MFPQVSSDSVKMSYQKLVTWDDDIGEDESTSICRKSATNSLRKRIKSVICHSPLNSNYRNAGSYHSLPNSPRKTNVTFFRFNGRKKGESEENLITYDAEDDNYPSVTKG